MRANEKKKKYGERSKVTLTIDEHAKLTEKLGADMLAAGIEILDAYMDSKGKKYPSCYSVFRESSWIRERLKANGWKPGMSAAEHDLAGGW